MDVTIPCVCGRHDEDVVTLRDTLDMRSALTVRNAVMLAREAGGMDAASILALMSEQYLLVGVEAWTLEDGKGKPIPVSRDTITEHLLSSAVAVAVAEQADELYGEKVVLPLLRRVWSSSPPGPTEGSTSATTPGSSRTRKPRSPSSTTSTQTAATETTSTSPAGASST